MKRAEQIIALFERFTANYQHFSELNDALLIDCDATAWHELLIKRSEAQRSILAENEDILKQARTLMAEPIRSKEEADAILVYYRRMQNLKLTDYCLFEIVYQPLLTFYEETKDYLRLIGLHVSASAIFLDCFCGIDISISPFNALKACQSAIACSKKVSPKENPALWISVLSAYANIIGSVLTYYPEQTDHFFEYYDEAISFFEDPDIGPLLLSLDNGPTFYSMILTRHIYSAYRYPYMSPENQEHFRDLIHRNLKNPPQQFSELENVILKYFVSALIGDLDPQTAFEKLLEYYRQVESPVFQMDELHIEPESFMTNAYILSELLSLLPQINYPVEQKHRLTALLFDFIVQLIHATPYAYMTNYVNTSCSNLFSELLPLLTDKHMIYKATTTLLILRQPITYIHSLMVREIAVTIGKAMLDKQPELFLPMYGSNVEEVLCHSHEIIKYISTAALLHDIGKCAIADIINNQYRRICDYEFSYIKLHPKKGPELLMENENFAPYYDVMLGHHKTYDGKGGYPAEFDNTASPYRIFIDLITIADCIDAATDILGRNYARGKNFYTLLTELSESKGSRYNPEIVELIENFPELCEQLNRLTDVDRSQIYYKAYRDVMNLNTPMILKDWD